MEDDVIFVVLTYRKLMLWQEVTQNPLSSLLMQDRCGKSVNKMFWIGYNTEFGFGNVTSPGKQSVLGESIYFGKKKSSLCTEIHPGKLYMLVVENELV